MALVQEKKGGPYTKHDQKVRKKKVYILHFERGHSAIKIADMLHVKRNIINEDIRYWYLETAKEFTSTNFVLVKQMQRLETQQARLSDELEKCTDFKERLSIEKLLFAINSKIVFYTSKMVFSEEDVFYNAHQAILGSTPQNVN